MKIFDHLDKIQEPFKNAVITIGNFDGVHIGHQALFHEVIEKAEIISGTSIAMTFEHRQYVWSFLSSRIFSIMAFSFWLLRTGMLNVYDKLVRSL